MSIRDISIHCATASQTQTTMGRSVPFPLLYLKRAISSPAVKTKQKEFTGDYSKGTFTMDLLSTVTILLHAVCSPRLSEIKECSFAKVSWK